VAYATVTDVQDRIARPLDPAEQQLAETLLADAERRIRRRIKDFDQRVCDDPDFRATVVEVEANAVLRVLKNPEGFRQELEGNYQYILNAAVASGYLGILPSEWAELGVRAPGRGTIAPVLRRPRRGITRTWDGW
jgi:hypothetical protein